MQLQDKVAVITGGTAGLGRGIAEAFLREGAKVVLNGRRADKGEKVIAELGAGDRAVFRQGDVMKKEDIDSLVDYAVEHFGRIDIMVNNAGGTAATSSTVFGRLIADSWANRSTISSNVIPMLAAVRGPFSRTISVITRPGHSELTVIPMVPTSLAVTLVSPLIACLAVT